MTVRKRRHWHFDYLSAGNLGGVLAGVAVNPFGDHFYVDPINGAAGNNGQSPTAAKATLAQALALCEVGKGDVIHVARGTQTVTSPVEIDVRGVVIVADQIYNPMGNGESFTIYGSHTDGPAAILKAPAIIVGLGFSGSQTTGPSLLIDCEEQGGYEGGFNWLYRCRFSSWLTGVGYALKTIGGALNLVEECTFDGLYYEEFTYGGFALGAILMEKDVGGQQPYDFVFKNNLFMNIGAGKYCFNFQNGSKPTCGLIVGNTQMGDAKFLAANGATPYSVMIADNYPNKATDTGSYDDTVTNLKALGFDFANNHYAE